MKHKREAIYGSDIVVTCSLSSLVCFGDNAYRILKKKWAAKKSKHSEDEIIEMTALLVRTAVWITAYATDVIPALNSSESVVTPAPPGSHEKFIQGVVTSQNSYSL